MSESWHIGRVAQKSGPRVHGVRCCKPKGLQEAPRRSGGGFPPCRGLTLGLLAAAFNADSRRGTEACGAGAQYGPPSRRGRGGNTLWLITTLAIALVAPPCCPGSVECDVAKDKPPAATSGDSTVRAVPARFRGVITAAGYLSSTFPRRALTTPAAPSIVQPPLTELSAEAEPLRSDFNRNASSIRLLLILSPS